MVPRIDRAAPPARVAGRVGEDGMIDDDDYEAPPPRRPLLRRKRVLIPLGVLLAIFAAFLLLRTPDTARDAMIAKRSEEHTSELQSLMRNSYAAFCLKKKKKTH